MAGSSPPDTRPGEHWKVFAICVFLAGIVWLVFGQTLHFLFVNYDDDKYVFANSMVQKGITWEGFRWAFTYGEIGHWHPLTWISHMLDCQLYGLNPAGHHLTNVLLHTATVILLFLVLRQMTGYLWRCAFVAAVFAIHPLRAESVAWISERKDVLSGFFFMLTLGAYVRYAQRPPSLARYLAVALCLTLGLLSKNMLITTPFVLLLLDYWPLHRLSSPSDLRRRIIEKIPLFILSLGSCVATFLAPEHVRAAHQLSLALRLENAASSCVIYLWQLVHPFNLVCLYPNPAHLLPLGQVLGALALVLIISGGVYALRKKHPCLIVGWLWYLVMLVPVIGIVQISYYAHADRYTYLPQIGICLALVWLIAGLPLSQHRHRVLLKAISAVILAWLAFSAQIQTSFWEDGTALWSHAIAHTSGNFIAHSNYGGALLNHGRIDEGVAQFQIALKLDPDNSLAHANLGSALLQKGQTHQAIVELETALSLDPDDVLARYNLAIAFLQNDQPDEALAEYRKALQLDPHNEGILLAIGTLLSQMGDPEGAKTQLEQAFQINPKNLDIQDRLAWILATATQPKLRDGATAVRLAQSANAIASGKDPVYLRTLAAAYAEVARYNDAQQTIADALTRAQALGQTSLAEQLERDAKLYSAGLPLHQDVP